MTNDVIDLVSPMLRRHEGLRNKAYECSEGYQTVGIGRNLTTKGLSNDEIAYLFTNDLQDSMEICEKYAYWDLVSPPRQAALIDMAFQLGATGYSKFVKMHLALQDGNWTEACRQCLDSLYAKQTPERAQEIANILLTGEM